MGDSVLAQCDCGFMSHSLIGGGMEDFQEVCSFPCFCKSCDGYVEANLLGKPEPHCPKCQSSDIVPYDDPQLVGSVGENKITSWYLGGGPIGRDLILHDGTYLCPLCKQFTLRFEHGFYMFD